jgi:hypothetical protein
MHILSIVMFSRHRMRAQVDTFLTCEVDGTAESDFSKTFDMKHDIYMVWTRNPYLYGHRCKDHESQKSPTYDSDEHEEYEEWATVVASICV